MLGDRARNKTERTLDEIELFDIGGAVRVIRKIGQYQSRIRRDLKHAAIPEQDANRPAGICLNDIALQHRIADVEHDGNAVTDHGRVAFKLGHLPDGLCGGLLRRCGGVLPRGAWARESRDHSSCQRRTVRRLNCRGSACFEVARNDVNIAVATDKREVVADAFEISVKQQLRINDRNAGV